MIIDILRVVQDDRTLSFFLNIILIFDTFIMSKCIVNEDNSSSNSLVLSTICYATTWVYKDMQLWSNLVFGVWCHFPIDWKRCLSPISIFVVSQKVISLGTVSYVDTYVRCASRFVCSRQLNNILCISVGGTWRNVLCIIVAPDGRHQTAQSLANFCCGPCLRTWSSLHLGGQLHYWFSFQS